MSNTPGLQQFSISIKQLGQLEPLSGNQGLQQLMHSKRMAKLEPMSCNPGPQQVPIPNKGVTQIEPMSNNLGLQRLSAQNKRTGWMESTPSKPGSQQLSQANKQTVQMESMSNKLGSQQLAIPKKRTAPMEPSPKGQTEAYELVRSKMRESLAASLAMVSQQQSKLEAVGSSSQNEAAITASQAHDDPQPAESTSANVDIASCHSHIPERHLETSPKDHYSAQKHNDGQSSSQEILTHENTEVATKTLECDRQEIQLKHVIPEEDIPFSNSFIIRDELLQGNGLCWASDPDVVEMKESHSFKRPKLVHEEIYVDGGELTSPSQTLAIKIEAELFKLFGGVNKKYKEKGRSLLFNLKDPNNPELRERVMSGEISPERLCSMTAEELASRELSQWRLAKAEELAQMVVLADSEVDIWRLVKKTHKGEFQVEVEQDDSVSVEVSVGASSLSQYKSRTDEKVDQLPSRANETDTSEATVIREKSNSEVHSLPGNLATLPHDGTDLMQGLMVEELKDAEFLPPIVSLNDFMESLDSEPPFENLPVDAGQTVPASDEKKSDVSKVDSSDLGLVVSVDIALNKLDKNDIKYTRTDSNVESSCIHLDSETPPSGGISKGEHVWEGILQLNISAMVTVIGFFKSGEKNLLKSGLSYLRSKEELDSMHLRSSSKSFVCPEVVQLWLSNSVGRSGRAYLSEVVDSYVVDERVGFAEPAAGLELYFCPPHTRTVEMLSKHLPKDHTLNSMDDGLIGVVWRKAHITSTTSPSSSSHHKHNSKRQHHTSRHQKDTNVDDTSKPPLPMDPPPTNPELPPDDEPIDDVPPDFCPPATRDEDDLPEFDFVRSSNPPVLQFSGPNPSHGPIMAPFNSPAQPPSRPVKQMRELIHKYGQIETNANSVNWQQSQGVGVEVEPWNDDDDDIPEWQPQPPIQQLPSLPVPPVQGFQQLTPQPQILNQPLQPPHHPSQPFLPLAKPLPMPLQPLQPPMNAKPGHGQLAVAPMEQQGAWRAPLPGFHGLPVRVNGVMQPYHNGGLPNEGQLHGTPGFGARQNFMDWRQGASRSRGF